jgi:hypothetical protein
MNYPFDCISDLFLLNDPPERADVIFYPGGSHPQLMVRDRGIIKQGFCAIHPARGGLIQNTKYTSEWEFLQKIALQQGVPEAAVLQENKRPIHLKMQNYPEECSWK